jgi:hypothetical protein
MINCEVMNINVIIKLILILGLHFPIFTHYFIITITNLLVLAY